MTPDQIEAIAKAIVAELGLPIWLWVAVSIIGAIGGAYFGAYFRKTAEIDATTDRFEQLQSQLEKTTHLTEEVRRAVNDRGWLMQQRWSKREEKYVRLLRAFLGTRRVVYAMLKTEHEAPSVDKELWAKFEDVLFELETELSIAPIFITDKKFLEEVIPLTKVFGQELNEREMLEHIIDSCHMAEDKLAAIAQHDLQQLEAALQKSGAPG